MKQSLSAVSLLKKTPLIMPNNTEILSRLATPVGAAVALIAVTKYLVSRGSSSKSKLPYPPGPKALPLIGNALDFPRNVPVWEGFSQMAEKYRTSIVRTTRWRVHNRNLT